MRRPIATLNAAGLAVLLFGSAPASAFRWTPSKADIDKYRASWNPMSHGPILNQTPDIQPAGQWLVRELFFSEIGDGSYGNALKFASERSDGPVRLRSVAPTINTSWGLTDHLELGAAVSHNSWWARDLSRRGDPDSSGSGLGDLSLVGKYRPIVQDPDGPRPTITLFSQVALPTSRWLGTPKPPGGFAPVGRLPSTRFGELSLTEGVLYRKILRPFRVSGGVFYTYAAPGSESGSSTYTGDIINNRLILEHILNDRRGFGYMIELATLHGLSSRLDGHSLNKGQLHGFNVIGVEPALEWNLGDSFVAAGGVLFTVAAQNAQDAIYPNLSFLWYWSRSGEVRMR